MGTNFKLKWTVFCTLLCIYLHILWYQPSAKCKDGIKSKSWKMYPPKSKNGFLPLKCRGRATATNFGLKWTVFCKKINQAASSEFFLFKATVSNRKMDCLNSEASAVKLFTPVIYNFYSNLTCKVTVWRVEFGRWFYFKY